VQFGWTFADVNQPAVSWIDNSTGDRASKNESTDTRKSFEVEL